RQVRHLEFRLLVMSDSVGVQRSYKLFHGLRAQRRAGVRGCFDKVLERSVGDVLSPVGKQWSVEIRGQQLIQQYAQRVDIATRGDVVITIGFRGSVEIADGGFLRLASICKASFRCSDA